MIETDFEKLGVFYLGRKYDFAAKKPLEDLLLYESNDLLTHAVCIGMTGSGKTGLCLGLLEEAAIDGIAIIAIDVKGDLGNLLTEDASQPAERLKLLREANEVLMITPGSSSGMPVSVLKSFAAPPPAVLEDTDEMRDRINTAVSSILVMLGTDADPLQSREHILLANILKSMWQNGTSLEIGDLIQLIQKPPMTRIGSIDLESIFPAKERFEFAMRLNNLLASPGFESWMQGPPLEIDWLLYGDNGKARTSIFYIAHLNDTERMFFVSLLLNRIVSWMRAQSGTPSLRAILFMDEIFGYFPPVANPPSKQPLLTLLKQARAFGLGVLLATQNPVDIDYKGLANAGTWFLGRLQTERDKARVLDGLEGASGAAGDSFDRAEMDKVLSGLGSRVFLMNNVHDAAPQLFQTRNTLSKLTGPLTLAQIKQLKRTLSAPQSEKTSEPRSATAGAGAGANASASMPRQSQPALQTKSLSGSAQPLLPPDIKATFLPVRTVQPANAKLIYRPRVLGVGNVRFTDAKSAVDTTLQYCVLATVSGDVAVLDWTKAQPAKVWIEDLQSEPAANAVFEEPASSMSVKKSYDGWQKEFTTWLYASKTVRLYKCEATGDFSKPRESERDFRIRLSQTGREKRDAAVSALKAKWEPKLDAFEQRIQKAEQALAREQAQVREQQMNSAVTLGATVLGAFVGRRRSSMASLTRASSAARTMGRAAKEQLDVQHAAESLERLQQQAQELDAAFAQEMSAIDSKFDPVKCTLLEVSISPKKTNIAVPLLALAWAPYWQSPTNEFTAAWIRSEG